MNTYRQELEEKAEHKSRLYHENKAAVADYAKRQNVHLTFEAAVLCGEIERSMNRLPAGRIKNPLTLSLEMAQHRQRKVLDGRSICPSCWKKLQTLGDLALAELLARDTEFVMAAPAA